MKNKEDIINKLLEMIKASQEVGDMSYSTGNELTTIVQMLQYD